MWSPLLRRWVNSIVADNPEAVAMPIELSELLMNTKQKAFSKTHFGFMKKSVFPQKQRKHLKAIYSCKQPMSQIGVVNGRFLSQITQVRGLDIMLKQVR